MPPLGWALPPSRHPTMRDYRARDAEDGFRVRSLSSAVSRAQAIVREFSPSDVSLADELMAERRIEAGRE